MTILPMLSRQKWIVTDDAVMNHEIGAILYITHKDILILGDFFSTLQAPTNLVIKRGTGNKSFQSCIITFKHPDCCAIENYSQCTGIYILSTVSHFQATAHYLAGSTNLFPYFTCRTAPAHDSILSDLHVCGTHREFSRVMNINR